MLHPTNCTSESVTDGADDAYRHLSLRPVRSVLVRELRITFTNMLVPSLLIAVESRENLVQPRPLGVL